MIVAGHFIVYTTLHTHDDNVSYYCISGCDAMCDCLKIQIPGTCQFIRPGNKVKLGRFGKELWIVSHGWFTFGGNRPFCGWYLTDQATGVVRPLQRPDLDDIYLVQS